MGKYLVKISTSQNMSDPIEIPIGDSYKTTTQTLVTGGRNTKGELIIEIKRQTIKKIEMSWKVISASDYSALATFFNTNYTFWATYFDCDANTWVTSQFYVGDRVADTIKRKQLTTTSVMGGVAPAYYENFKLSLIEV